MKRKIILIFISIFLITNYIIGVSNVSLAEEENKIVEEKPPQNKVEESPTTGPNQTPKPGSYLSPYPVFNSFVVSKEDDIVKIPQNTTVIDVLSDITIKLMDDETGREWKLTDLPQTYIDETDGQEKNALELVNKTDRSNYIYAAYVEIEENKDVEIDEDLLDNKMFRGDIISFEVINKNGKYLELDDIVGTGTKIRWGTIAIAGEIDIMEEISVNGDVTGDGINNIYDITGLVSLVYDQDENYKWEPALKNAAIVTNKDKEKPDIYDVQQMIVNNFDN